MIKVVLVDDERPSLMELKYFLSEYPDIEITGMYTNPLEAIEAIKVVKPDVVFLDINMPQLRGIDAASEILEADHEINIVFVTAYDQYAIDAFEVHAMDYILKPIVKERFDKTIERILKSKSVKIERNSKRLKIRCFGGFQVSWENHEPIKWRTEKTRELFAFLIFNHDRCISKDELLDKLWTEDDPEKAIRQLYNGIYYIRKALESYGVEKNQISIGNNYNVILGDVDYDVGYFCDKSENLNSLSIDDLKDVISIYSDDYLRGDYFLWMDFERQRLSNLYYLCLIRLSEKYMEEQQWDAAESILLRSYNKYPLEETITEKLLKLYLTTNNRLKAIQHMEMFSEFIKEELDIKPNKTVLNLYSQFF